MARRKKPENETNEDAKIRRALEAVADSATRSEKVSWDRKMDNMVALLAKLRPIEEQLSDLMVKKMELVDTISALRHQMVRECVHPFDSLTYFDDGVRCKFCNHTFNKPPKQD